MKNRKLLVALSLGLTFVLSACSNMLLPSKKNRSSFNDGFDSSFVDSKKSSSPAPISSDPTHEHKFENWVTIKEPTCTEKGVEIGECQCGETYERQMSALGHEWGEWDTMVARTCTQSGVISRQCSRCLQKEESVIEPLGHNWLWSDVTVPATCTESGRGIRYCTRCAEREEAVMQPKGHSVQEVGEMAISQDSSGKNKVHVYSCINGCGYKYFSFSALDCDPTSGQLVMEQDSISGSYGYRYWGRPIGNAMELDEYGSATSGDVPKVFDENVLGDKFDYTFELSQSQLDAIGEDCLLYCDAKPADYLNGQDFFARDPRDDEWTPGYYIEGEHKGEIIDPYRYILYVDDAPVEFDPTMKAPVSSGNRYTNLPRAEYAVPYVFHLHTGVNSFSLRMAGGYRSIFFNFIFRPYVETYVEPEHEHVWGEPQFVNASVGQVSYEKYVCEDGDATKLEIKAPDGTLSDGTLKSNIPDGYIRLNDNGAMLSYTFNYYGNSTKAKLYQRGVMNNWSTNQTFTYATTKTETSNGCSFVFNFNGIEVNMDATKNIPYIELLSGGVNEPLFDNQGYSPVNDCLVGEIDLLNGVNQFTFQRLSTYVLTLSAFVIVIE